MNKTKYKIIIPLLALIVASVACSKSFLTKNPLGALSPASVANLAGVNKLLIGAYSMLDGQGGAVSGNNFATGPDNWAFGNMCADDCYKGSIPSDQNTEGAGPMELWTMDPTDPYMESKWQALYDGIQRANDVIRTIPLATDISADQATQLTAEARFLRGHYHLEAHKVWKNIPYVDETITVGNGNLSVPNNTDTWPQIEADFQFAIDNLPETQPQIGRANSWAAKAFLAKCYVFTYDWAKAKTLLDDIIANGQTAGGKKYALNANYYDNFNAATKNNQEGVFTCQMSVNDGGGTNGGYGEVLNFPNSAGPGGCCGFANPSFSAANAFKVDAAGLPLLDGSFNSGLIVGDVKAPYLGVLDPRVDLCMGRPGIPYLDWGPVPSQGTDPTKLAWIRDITSDGYISPKKHSYAKSQQGTYSSTESAIFWGSTQVDANNVNIIRFADVLLWAAEAEINVGSPAQALIYVNMIRARAANTAGWVYAGGATYNAGTGMYSPQTTPAATYNIKPYPAGAFDNLAYAINAIRFERRLELNQEGHRNFDLQRYDSDPKYPQDMAATINAYLTAEKTRPTNIANNPSTTFTKGKNELFPIPQKEVDLENNLGTINLVQNPNY
jgi:starch-binding outer membrane protein, SusD/RagB family